MKKRIETLERTIHAHEELDQEIAALMRQLPPEVVEQIMTDMVAGQTGE